MIWNLFKLFKRKGRIPWDSYEALTKGHRRAQEMVQKEEGTREKDPVEKVYEIASLISSRRRRNEYIREKLGIKPPNRKRPPCVCKDITEHLLICKSAIPCLRKSRNLEKVA